MKKSEYIKLLKSFGLITGIIFIIYSCRGTNEKKIQTEIDHIAAKWVPDRRVGICNVKLKSGENGAVILTGETTNLAAKNEIIKTLNNQSKTLIDSIIFLPDTIRNKKYMGLVTLSVINLRKEPDHASELVSQARLGTPVLILKNINSWVLIQTPDNYISWTEESCIKAMSRMEMAVWKKASRVIYQENTGWLYDSTSDNSGIVGDLVGGSIMEKIGELNHYVIVVLPDGRKGFVEMKKVLDFDRWKSTVPCTEESICGVAITYLGLPYLWGGSSAKAVDCSGFVQSVYFMNGLILARDASLQALHGNKVDIDDGYGHLRKGDLLFFGSKENGIAHVTHVAIYLGNKEYINSSGRVMVNSLDPAQINYSSHRMNSLLAAKRIIGVENDMGIVPVIKHPWY
jgi:Cell wall-associated hydrolases (invasion-associated proteins)